MPRILCYGDSNTHGTPPLGALGEIARHAPGDRWPRVMAAALGPACEVIDEGLPGRTTVHDDPIEGAWKNGLAVLPAILESHRPLDLVVICLGTNDLKARFSLTAFDIAEGCRRLIETVAGSRAGIVAGAPSVLLIAPPPIVETGVLAEAFAGGAAKSRAMGARMAEAAARTGAGFFDAGTVAEVDPADGIHYSAETHRGLGVALAVAVRERLEAAAR